MQRQFKKQGSALLLVLPQLIITLIFFFGPAFVALKQSFFQSDVYGIHQRFVGITNFIELLHSSSYLNACKVSLIFSFAVSFLTLSVGLLFAVLINEVTKGKRIYKVLLLLPYAVAPAVSGILWRFLFNPAVGWFPYLLHKIGYNWNHLIHPYQALALVVLASSWQQLSYNFLFFYAALKSIPTSIIEAAKLDGASGFKRFWSIVFPLLSPTTFFLMVINLIYAFFDTFGVIQVMTEGGPAGSTTTLVYKVYTDGFIGLDIGSSAAQSVILMLIVGFLTVLQFRYIDKKVHY